MRTIQSVATAVVAALGALLVSATPAHATIIDNDQVSVAVSGNAIYGSVNWTSYYGGSGQVTVYNDMSDGVCATAQQRVMRGGVWSAWTTIVILCTQHTYPVNVWINANGQVVQYWQFRIADAHSDWAYDTNSPGGA
jgi:hypothetical protein